MTPLQLRALIAVADLGGFTVAAERLGMSQPAVSRAVGSLEAELGAGLLARNRDGATLTEAGRVALEHAREAIRQIDLLSARVSAVTGEVTGTLRLASLPSATATLVTSRLRSFTDRYPQVRVRLFEGSEPEVRGWLEQGAADVGVVTLPAPGLHTVELDTHEMLVVLPTGHPLARHPSVSFDQLAGQPFILSTGGCGPVITTAAREVGVRLDVTYEAREMAAVLEMVGSGLGVSILPSRGLTVDENYVVTRTLAPSVPRSLGVALGMRSGNVPAARAFLDHVEREGSAHALVGLSAGRS